MSRGRRKGARIAPWRRRVQWLCTLFVLAIPFVTVRGGSLLRLDAPTRTLLVLGGGIRIEEFYLFLVAALIFVFGFLFVTMIFGRIWCGWLCPQTALCDLADWLYLAAERLFPWRLGAAAARQLAYLALAALMACNLVWYFIAPADFFARLFSGRIGNVAGVTLAVTFLVVYLDLALVRRKFCSTVCPYGRMQLLAMERGTLTLEFDPSLAGACLRCGACVRACPMGIDIRDGLQVECINCGRCLDACRDVMERRGGSGLIHYTFGGSGERTAAVKRKALLFSALTLLLVGLLVAALALRQEATVKVQRSARGEVRRLPDGSAVNFYAVFLENRSDEGGTYSLQVTQVPGYRLELVGPVRDLEIAANANRKVDLALKVTPAPPERMEAKLTLMKQGIEKATAQLPVLVE